MFLANAADTKIRLRDTDAVDVSLEVFDRTVAVGMRGHLICTRYAIPVLLARGGGVMLYMSSDGTRMAEPRRVCYAMTKSAVNALMRHVASRWGKGGIRANAISPGLIETETVMASHTAESRATILSATRSPRLGKPADIAAMVAMLMSDDGAFIQGQVISVNGGIVLRE
jgi:NAD(P)-dependent dehydrogenase (short-subunit alcohol dehydrogenase family)